MTKGDIDRLAFMLFIAGNAAIANTITLGTLTLLQHPVQLRALRSDPSLIKPAVEEILRYHTPSALNSRRVATEDLVLGGKVNMNSLASLLCHYLTHSSYHSLSRLVRELSAQSSQPTGTPRSSHTQMSSISSGTSIPLRAWPSASGRTGVRHSGSPRWLWSLLLVRSRDRSRPSFITNTATTGALVHGLPNLRVAVPENELEYSPPTQNIGLMQFPVYF